MPTRRAGSSSCPRGFTGCCSRTTGLSARARTIGRPASENGEVGEAAGFTILKSNNVPNTTGDEIQDPRRARDRRPPMSNRCSTCRPISPRSDLATRSRGFMSTAPSVVRPDGLACLIANKA